MTVTCPAGHESTSADYCDRCGLLIGSDAAPSPSRPMSANGAAEDVLIPERARCPVCGEDCFADERYCESCGSDLSAPHDPAGPEPDGWEALLIRDRAYFDTIDAGDLDFPPDSTEKAVRLASAQATIGRSSSSRAERPDIDLSTPPEDPGVSRQHAVLELRPDGTWSITDAGSINGTYLNDDPEQLPAGEAIVLSAGDRVHVGAWTTIVVRRIRGLAD